MLILLGGQRLILRPEDKVRSYLALGLGIVIILQFFWLKWRRNRA